MIIPAVQLDEHPVDIVWEVAVTLSRGQEVMFCATSDDGRSVTAYAFLDDERFVVSADGHITRVEDNAADLAVYVAQLSNGRPLPSPSTNADQAMQDMLWRTSVRREQAIARAQWT